MFKNILTCAVAIFLLGCKPADSARQPAAAEITVSVAMVPASIAIVHELHGDYSQHRAAGESLLREARSRYEGAGIAFGEYPEDPDAVGVENTSWRLGVYLVRSAGTENADVLRTRMGALASPTAPYTLRVQEPTEAAILQTTIARSRDEGLKLLSWLAENNWVQAGPTRMEFLDDRGAPDTAVRIIAPIRRRSWSVDSIQ